MDSSHILITGANGQLGAALQNYYPDAVATDSQALNITNTEALKKFDWSGITHIINAAAYTNVDGAETEQGRIASWSVNAKAAANLASISREKNLVLIHVSSDYVFDGSIQLHYENEAFAPLSVYGASKTAGDIAVAQNPNHYILRTSWVIGEGKNFVSTMVGLAARNISPVVVCDQIGRLTFATELVRAIDHLLTCSADYGTYNISNTGESASWADIARRIYSELKRDDLNVTDTTTSEYFKDKPNIAPRPLQSTLDLGKIQSTGFEPREWTEMLTDYIREHGA